MKKLRLELLDENDNVVVTHTLDYDENQGKRMIVEINGYHYVMNTEGKLVILQKEIEQRIIDAKQQTKLKFYNPKTGEMEELFK